MTRAPIKCPTCNGPVGIPKNGFARSPRRALTVVYSCSWKNESSASAYGSCSNNFNNALRSVRSILVFSSSSSRILCISTSISFLRIVSLISGSGIALLSSFDETVSSSDVADAGAVPDASAVGAGPSNLKLATSRITSTSISSSSGIPSKSALSKSAAAGGGGVEIAGMSAWTVAVDFVSSSVVVSAGWILRFLFLLFFFSPPPDAEAHRAVVRVSEKARRVGFNDDDDDDVDGKVLYRLTVVNAAVCSIVVPRSSMATSPADIDVH
mmetsp:Transcript_52664/g.127683  ORF Transcript_52664/g.127683 Transcript_52664/m.127683 type:complete len:268 (+) Transcript_52664:1721-2524(+)